MSTNTRSRSTAKRATRHAKAETTPGPFSLTVDISKRYDATRRAYTEGVLSKGEWDKRKAELDRELNDAVTRELDHLGTLGPLGVTIGTTVVVSGELIESVWGNQVRADLLALNAGKAELTGATFTGAVLGIAPTLAAHLTRKDYVDTALALKADLAGATFTGAVSGTTLGLAGSITITGAGFGIALPSGEPSAANRAARKDYIDTADALRALKAGDTFSGDITIGGNPTTPLAGARVRADGVIFSTLTVAGGSTSATNNISHDRTGTGAGQPGDVGGKYELFQRAGVGIGSIAIATSTTVAYATTSDPRLKEAGRPITNALKDLRSMAPMRSRFKGATVDQLMWDAERVQAVMPHGVVIGKPGARLTAAKAKAQGYGKPGDIDPMMMDYGQTTPLIAAAVLELEDRLAKLEGKAKGKVAA